MRQSTHHRHTTDTSADTLLTFQFSLGKVRLALEKFHKAQRSHQHATDAPPTHLVPYKFKEWPTRRPTVGRQLAVCGPSVGRLSADCWPTRWPTCLPTRRWDRILTFTEKWITRCCNIVFFLASTRNGNFLMGRTRFFLNE